MTDLRIEQLLDRVMTEAKALKIPFSAAICRPVIINSRAIRRLGCCIRKNGTFTIELSSALLSAKDRQICQTLAHELLHTCYGCQNHGKRWKSYAEKMNNAYGYRIARTEKEETVSVVMPVVKTRYTLFCDGCGVQIVRYRRSALVQHPERYRCRCGGTLKFSDQT